MTNNFSNSILLIVFNYSKHIENKDFLINLYKKHFKKIITELDLNICQAWVSAVS
jgi:hypothetical protein